MKKAAKTFQDLIVWKKAHQFVMDIYILTEMFPDTKLYGLTSQLRRSAVSIPANIYVFNILTPDFCLLFFVFVFCL